ncbi:hypothetical protein [Limnoglobus roseus]|uniref:DUF11 domain-containing protein n=1 Tax=Limnoglobus roseus TaxID=2598579 RepID=A0A5C1AU55_9BACT|nr:hypothetical protein [Limnoglobus roseus]QEL20754.1 hypothetical protein PX52LOC_07864 [Limnoglobus roseus]
MHKVIGLLFVLFVAACVGFAFVALDPGPADPAGDESPAVVVLDADVPGTTVFRGPDELGVVPLTLTPARLDELGLGHVTLDPVAPLAPDPRGGTLHLRSGDDKPEERLALRVPDAVADRYKGVETPWGRRTVPGTMSGASRPTGLEVPRLRVSMAPAATADGLRFRVRAADRAPVGAPVVLTLTAENVGAKPVAGTRPEVTLSAVDRHGAWRAADQFEATSLPAAWGHIAPGQAVEWVVRFVAPDRPGEYNLTANLLLRASPADGHAGASTLSNVELLRVR